MISQFSFEPYYPHLEKYLQWPRIVYLQPFSSRCDKFVQWPRQPYSFVTDDFCHEKNFAIKFTARTARSIIKIKQYGVNSKSKLNLGGQVKLWFDLPSSASLFAQIKSNDYLKVIYDHGVRAYRGNYYYAYSGIDTNKVLNDGNIRIGLGHISQNCNSENKLKVSLNRHHHTFRWYHKTYLAWKKFRMGYLTVVDLRKALIQKNNLIFGWHFNSDTCGFIRAQVEGFRQNNNPKLSHLSTIFDTITVDLIHRFNSKSKGALEVTFDSKNNKIDQAKVVYQFQYEYNKIIKISLNNSLDLAFLTKIPLYGLEDIATLLAGFCATRVATKESSLKTGFELNINL